jgi:hypothetical protein
LSNIEELPDLAGDVRARAVPPPYDEVRRRVRARRGRTEAGTLAATALVVGGLAIWQDVATTASPSPAPSIPQPADPAYPASADWQQVVGGTDSHVFEIQGDDTGSIAVVWRALEQPAPTFALVIREADGALHGRVLDEPVSLTPVPGGWVGARASRAWFIADDGTWTELAAPGPSRGARAGDVMVRGTSASWLYSPADRSLAALDVDSTGTDGYVTPDGVLTRCLWNGRNQIFFSPSDVLRQGLPGKSCVIAGRGDDLAIVSLGDDPDGDIPMTGLMTYSGDTWRYPSANLLDGVSSVVMTPGGSTMVTGASTGRAILVRADGEVTTPDQKVGQAFVAGDRLYATTYAQDHGPLYFSDDDGDTWSETTLPGLE